ncbi:MAG: acetyl-CoA acetyltransferase [Candidatus Binatia bacterium]|nr:MAG: acetyl-CoA acetyltransferase [Candidatus Binatia bacterium]
MAELRDAFLVGYVRTPFGKADPVKGVFRRVRSDDLAAAVLSEALRRTGISANDVDGVILGAVEMMGEQAHPGTTIPFLCDFPEHVVGLSVERACTTAMMAVHIAALYIQCGMGDVYLAGGLDSMTHFRIPVMKDGMDMEEVVRQAGTMLSAMNPNPRMAAKINLIDLNGGQGAERLCERLGIGREEMDEWALRSHRRAVEAQRSGRLREEIVPVEGLDPEGKTVLVEHDQCPRPDTTLEKIRSLPPVYRPDGKITAATASAQADGAAVCVLVSGEKARRLGVRPWARIHTMATGACHPTDLIYSAIPATRRALERSGLGLGDMGVIEINEAFACAPIALMKEFGLKEKDAEKINPNGGACAIGHPVGASGARLVGTCAIEMRRRGYRYGLATICGGMGQGAATILENCD